jgi:hypothetical protein
MVMCLPSHDKSLVATLSSKGWKWILFSTATERGRPRYFMGNLVRVARKACRMWLRLTPSHLIGATYLFVQFVTRLVMSSKKFKVETKKSMSFLLGLIKTAASSV